MASTSTAELNAKVVRQHFEAINQQDWGTVLQSVHPEVKLHSSQGRPIVGVDVLIRMCQMGANSFKDMHEELLDVFAGGEDRVCVRGRRTGFHHKPFMAVPASNKTITTTWIAIYRLEAGKIVERWMNHDDVGFLQQIGMFPQAGHGGGGEAGAHGHSHGGAAAEGDGAAHGHSHGGKPCHGHGTPNAGSHGHGHDSAHASSSGAVGAGAGAGAPTPLPVTNKFPTGVDGLSADWLQQVLKSRGYVKSSTVNAFEAQAHSATSSPTGERASRLSIRYEGSEATAPNFMIARFPSNNPMARRLFRAARTHTKLVKFYEDIAPEIKSIAVPTCYYSEQDRSTDDFILLLEDLSLSATRGDQMRGCTVEQATLAVTQLGVFHAEWWNSRHFHKFAYLKSPPATEMVALQSYAMSWTVFQRTYKGFTEPQVAFGQLLASRLQSLYERDHQAPLTLCHNDLQLGNVYFSSSQIHVTSWREVSTGHGAKDVAFLLAQGLSPADRKSHEAALLKTYHGTLLANGVSGYKFGQCLTDYKVAVMLCFAQNVCNAAGLFMLEERGQLQPGQKRLLIECKMVFQRLLAAVDELRLLDTLREL
eukprot:CAMPEP_0177672872 /NCGR_PEP_ID=MMETSP0447-20121125/25598_1 /TAXON_ID=0 /ORGANISM="Stygamoeba regulata, Strain BSH-02190019" /LENGTH=590 /DNA_ID=CAMNT_0019180619 /DNA_START=251 /DNA_END=2023 /DNA_ORIENTATION=+